MTYLILKTKRGLLDKFSSQHDEFHSGKHEGSLTHELLAGAASYEAAKAYEKHCAENGKPTDHTKAKEIMAAISGGIVDKLIETKGLDAVDAAKAKHQAKKNLEDHFEVQ
ncbi:hypothetical protein BCR43DRAFT_506335 [Syncephalastrum racemosum]|uniref:CipC protein n=1 Tax=Syncephalastrum racemosum TaxID=13706 RepID=A0A1X2HCH1_SYNRA|nr:hypothetical protein BCR43DRAFT_506335 [Syncephalastrum racemosum]